MSQASNQTDHVRRAVRTGLLSLVRPEPLTLVEWANENFYLSSESSYIEGRWETLPFQVAMMNAIGHPDVQQVNIIKSARVGYSQMLRAALGYFAEHKARNQILFQPTDAAANGFMKAHIETMIRDVPAVKMLAPWHGKKHRDNTLDTKRFSNGKQLWCFGGKAAKNYREKSADVAMYDELAAFDDDVEKEGSPTFLGDKRLEGSAFPKSVRGSTPKNAGSCQITKAAEEAECFFRFHLPCPHCDQEQILKWGGPDCDFGIKWNEGKPETAAYLCEHCGALIENNQLMAMQLRGVWRCDHTGISTTDGMAYLNADGKHIDPPETVAFHVWTAYSPFTTWARIVKDWLKAHKDRSKLKTFVNTTLGETWEEDEGEKLEPEALYARREHYQAEIPVIRAVITCAVDTQDDRFEIQHKAWVAGEESFALTYERIYGDLSRSEVWEQLYKRITRPFKFLDGTIVEASICLIDSGGHFTDEVYQFCKKRGVRKFIPIKGHNQLGKPIASFPRKRNDKGVYLTMLGTDTWKELVAARLLQLEPGPGYMHYPVNDSFDEDFFKHLTNERRIPKMVRGKRVLVWDDGGRRQEPFDLEGYNLAAIRLLQQHFGKRLPPRESKEAISQESESKQQAKKATQKRKEQSSFINYDNGKTWL